MRALRFLVVVLLGIVASGAALAWLEIRRGVSARAEPSTVETLLAIEARRLAVPSHYENLRNPYASPDNIETGMEHFADHCATCHGNDGSGDTLLGKGLYPKPPDMRKAETQNKTDGELYYTVEDGVRLSGMPAFGEEHAPGADADTWKLVLFIRHLPHLTADEKKRMEELNPKTEQDRQEEKEEEEFLQGGEVPALHGGETGHR